MTRYLDSQQLERFANLLNGIRTVRINGPQLWVMFAKAFPHRTFGSEEREMFLDALQALQDRGVLRLPSQRGDRWDRSMHPPVPNSVDLIQEPAKEKVPDWRHYPWHTILHWVSGAKGLSKEQLKFLERVQKGFVDGEFLEPAPMKYRSLQLTGNEKRLASLSHTSLFGPGRLTLNMLGCLPEILPIAWESVGEGATMIIFENAGPFVVARRVLSEMKKPPYALVGYGAGGSLLGSLGHLNTISRGVQRIEYVGDLDIAGLEIAVAAQNKSLPLNLPEIQPASRLHRAMLNTAAAFGFPKGWPDSSRPSSHKITELINFLSAEARNDATQVIQSGNRIPEEVLGPVEMRTVFEAENS